MSISPNPVGISIKIRRSSIDEFHDPGFGQSDPASAGFTTGADAIDPSRING
jgi:hypothetical protein